MQLCENLTGNRKVTYDAGPLTVCTDTMPCTSAYMHVGMLLDM